MSPLRSDDFPQSLLDDIRARAADEGRSVQEEIEDVLAYHRKRTSGAPTNDDEPCGDTDEPGDTSETGR